MGGVSGALMGGLSGGIDAFHDDRNVWTGGKVEIGRNPFSINTKPVPMDELFYIREDGIPFSVKLMNSSTSQRINPRYAIDDGTYDKASHNLTLENNSRASASVSVKVPQSRIKGYVGVSTGKYYYPKDGGIRFTSNSGLNKLITTGPSKFTFSSRHLKLLNANIFGSPHNDGINYGTFTFKFIVRLKK